MVDGSLWMGRMVFVGDGVSCVLTFFRLVLCVLWVVVCGGVWLVVFELALLSLLAVVFVDVAVLAEACSVELLVGAFPRLFHAAVSVVAI